MATSHSLVALFRELAQLAALDEGSSMSFRARAYENAVEAIASYPGDLSALTERELTAIDGIGPATAKKVREFFQKGSIARLEELRRKYPPEFVALGRIPGIGPKTLLRLRDELGITNVETLAAALVGKKLRALPGLGVKTETKILQSIGRMQAAGFQPAADEARVPIAKAMPIVRELVTALAGLPAVPSVEGCGSLRRLDETTGLVDIVAATREPLLVHGAFAGHQAVARVLEQDDAVTSIETATGLRIDLRTVDPSRFGASCLWRTG